MSDESEADREMEKYTAFCALITETEVVVSIDQRMRGVILPKILMDPARTKPVDLIVSLANDPNTIADEEGFCCEMPTGFQVVIPWTSVFRIEDLYSDDEKTAHYWTEDDPGTKEFTDAFDETVDPSVGDALKLVDNALPRDPEKPVKALLVVPTPPPIKVYHSEKARLMAERLEAAHADWKTKQTARDARETLKKTLTLHQGRAKDTEPTAPRTGHLRLVK